METLWSSTGSVLLGQKSCPKLTDEIIYLKGIWKRERMRCGINKRYVFPTPIFHRKCLSFRLDSPTHALPTRRIELHCIPILYHHICCRFTQYWRWPIVRCPHITSHIQRPSLTFSTADTGGWGRWQRPKQEKNINTWKQGTGKQ